MCEFLILKLLNNYCYVVSLTIIFFSENFFKSAGEVVDVRFAMGQDNSFRGFGHVEFATAEAAAKVNFFTDAHVDRFTECKI